MGTKDLRKLFENEEPITLLDVRPNVDYQANPNTIKGYTLSTLEERRTVRFLPQ